ncbi:MAG: hemolysin family protein [Bacteroidota bacterium]|nr:hemolysin family protein [Bacteroidota bacterium]
MEPPPAQVLALLSVLQEVHLNTGDVVAGVIVLLVLLVLSSLFSGSEVALFTLDAADIEELREAEDAASKRVARLLDSPRTVLVTILIMNTVVNVGAAITAAIMTHEIATANNWSPIVTVVIEVIVLTFVILVVSEITPKLIASRQPITFSRRLSGVLVFLHRALLPISALLARSMAAFHGKFEGLNERISAEDLKTIAEIGEASGTLEQEEKNLIHSIVEFGETSVREIMISRLDIVALNVNATMAEAVAIIRENVHSRLPLYLEHLDNILGIVYAKDLLRFQTENPDETEIDWTRLARPAIFVPLGKMLDDLLTDFQAKRTHIALVVDEYGGTAGLVTLEDVLEEIVGEIRDEHDEDEEELIERISDTEFVVDARIDLDDLFEALGQEVDTEEFDSETMGAFNFPLASKITEVGDVFEHESISLEVTQVENNRIMQVCLRISEPQVEEDTDEDDK